MDPLLIPVFGMAIPIVIVPVVLGLRHARLERELEHTERMKALELGRTLPQDETWWSPPRLCALIGGGVPLGALVTALGASESLGYRDGIWVSAMIVSLAGVIGGTILAFRYLMHRERSQAGAIDPYAKPAADAEAYDFAGTSR